MASFKGLPPQLVSLIHHIELNKVGWWDRAIEHLAVATIWLAGAPLDAQAIMDESKKTFSLTLDPGRLAARLDSLCECGVLIRLPNGEFKISETSQKNLERDLASAEAVQNAAKERFVDLLRQHCPVASPEETWRSFTDGLLIPLVRQLGARTYKVVSAAGFDIDHSPRLEDFYKSCPGQDRAALRKAIDAFLDPQSDVVRAYILRYLNVHFFLEAAALNEENLKALASLPERFSFTLLLDTNVLFSVLGLHDNPSNEAAVLLVNLVKNLPASVSAKLYACPMTIREIRDVLIARQQALEGFTITPNMVEPAKRAGVSGATGSFMEQSKSEHGITASDYFKPYLSNLVRILRSKGVEFYNAEQTKYKTDRGVMDDIVQQLEVEMTPSRKLQNYEAVEHDVVLWHFVRDRRPSIVESPSDANFWIATLDFGFLGFDAFKRRQVQDTVPLCIHPSTLISMLQFWVPRNAAFDQAMIGALRLPFLFQEFDPVAERTTVRILQVLSRFENVGNLSEETMSNILLSDALREKILAEKEIDAQTLLVKEALIEEDNKVRQALSKSAEELCQLRRDDDTKRLAIEALKIQIENGATEKAELLQRIESVQGKLRTEEDSKKSLESRVNQLESAQSLVTRRAEVTRFLGIWVILAPLLIALGWWVTHSLGGGSWRLDAVTVCVLVAVWALLTSWDGRRRPIVRDTAFFSLFLKMNRWISGILGTLALGIIANALWETIK